MYTILFAEPVEAQTSTTKLCKYGLWCGRVDYTNNPSLFLSRLKTGQFDAIIVTAARWTTSNTLEYSANELSYFLTQVKNAFPKIEIWADICGYVYGPNLTTEALRQQCISAVKAFWNQFSGKLTGIVDDTEKWTGTSENQYTYFGSCASAMAALGVPYYPWLYYKYLSLTASIKCSVGLYGGHSYVETEWKTAIDKVQTSTTQSYTKSGYQIWLMADHYSNYPTVKQQLEFLDEQVSLHGAAYYSKMEMIGIWTYDQMTTEDWTAWTTWVNNHSTTTTSGSTSTTNSNNGTSTSTTNNNITDTTNLNSDNSTFDNNNGNSNADSTIINDTEILPLGTKSNQIASISELTFLAINPETSSYIINPAFTALILIGFLAISLEKKHMKKTSSFVSSKLNILLINPKTMIVINKITPTFLRVYNFHIKKIDQYSLYQTLIFSLETFF